MKHPKNEYDVDEVRRYLEPVLEMIRRGEYGLAAAQLSALANLVVEQQRYIEVLMAMPVKI